MHNNHEQFNIGSLSNIFKALKTTEVEGIVIDNTVSITLENDDISIHL